MTKTLTEQWREGTLPLNHYYVKTKSGRYGINHTVLSFDGDKPRTRLEYSDRTEEVLAPVPSYDEYKELTQRVGRLELDNEVLEDVVKECNKRGLENKKLQEQLKDAETALKFYDKKDFHYEVDGVVMGVEPAHKYFVKWGVK